MSHVSPPEFTFKGNWSIRPNQHCNSSCTPSRPSWPFCIYLEVRRNWLFQDKLIKNGMAKKSIPVFSKKISNEIKKAKNNIKLNISTVTIRQLAEEYCYHHTALSVQTTNPYRPSQELLSTQFTQLNKAAVPP